MSRPKPEIHAHQLADAHQIRDFALAGKARLTLVSKKTNTRFTYKVKKAKQDPPRWFVSYLRGSSNENDYTYIGHFADTMNFAIGRNVQVSNSAAVMVAFRWFLHNLRSDHVPDTLEVWHEGRCGRCGRLLTVPSSIERGIGPECAGIVDQRRLV